jgi:hypothetical protein
MKEATHQPIPVAETTAAVAASSSMIEDLLELSEEDLAKFIKGSCEITIDSAMSEWGSEIETLMHRLEKTVLLWHDPACEQRLTIVFKS